jgi:hypothetical protein
MNNKSEEKDEKCYYCEEIGTYWDQVGATIVSTCKKHSNNYYVS